MDPRCTACLGENHSTTNCPYLFFCVNIIPPKPTCDDDEVPSYPQVVKEPVKSHTPEQEQALNLLRAEKEEEKREKEKQEKEKREKEKQEKEKREKEKQEKENQEKEKEGKKKIEEKKKDRQGEEKIEEKRKTKMTRENAKREITGNVRREIVSEIERKNACERTKGNVTVESELMIMITTVIMIAIDVTMINLMSPKVIVSGLRLGESGRTGLAQREAEAIPPVNISSNEVT